MREMICCPFDSEQAEQPGIRAILILPKEQMEIWKKNS